ncbi:MAG: hypothetical protein RSC76_01680 [Oscillospiraceae bacterium]
MKQTVKVAFSGIFAALGVVILFLTGVIPVATIALPALAGCILIPVVAECGEKWGFGVFAATAILSFFLAGDREAVLIYALFFGYYPVLYAVLDKIRSKGIRYAVKLMIFNIAAVSEVLIATYIFGIPLENFSFSNGFLGILIPIAFLLLANLVFVVYDYALKGIIFTYFARLHKTAKKFLNIK